MSAPGKASFAIGGIAVLVMMSACSRERVLRSDSQQRVGLLNYEIIEE